MTASAEQLLNAALALPPDDRVEFIEALMVSLQPEDRPPFDESWRAVIRRRAEELRTGVVTAVSWKEVMRQAREKVAC